MILHVRDRPQPDGAGGRKICAAMFFTVELSLFRTVKRGTVDVAVGFSSRAWEAFGDLGQLEHVCFAETYTGINHRTVIGENSASDATCRGG
jgi:hypothetical protein